MGRGREPTRITFPFPLDISREEDTLDHVIRGLNEVSDHAKKRDTT